MPYETDGPTRDLMTARRPHPAEPTFDNGKPGIADREQLNRRLGLISTTIGLGITVITVITVALCRESLTRTRPPVVVMTVIIALLGLGVVGFAVGLQEVLQRYNRTLARAAMARQGEQARLLRAAVARQSEQARMLREVAEAMELLRQRLAAIEQVIAKLPDYGAGVIDGMQIRQSAVQEDRD